MPTVKRIGASNSEPRRREVLVTYVLCSSDELVVTLSDGRRLSFPLSWFPRLEHGTPRERNNWRLIAGGVGVNWPDLDEDLSLDGFLAGNRSAETAVSVRRWMESRRTKKTSKKRTRAA